MLSEVEVDLTVALTFLPLRRALKFEPRGSRLPALGGSPLVAAVGRCSENWCVWTQGRVRGPVLSGFGVGGWSRVYSSLFDGRAREGLSDASAVFPARGHAPSDALGATYRSEGCTRPICLSTSFRPWHGGGGGGPQTSSRGFHRGSRRGSKFEPQGSSLEALWPSGAPLVAAARRGAEN